MGFLNKLERKLGKYAISNLTLYLIMGYAAGYILNLFAPALLGWLTLNPDLVLRGQVWRLVTWVLIPPSTENILFYIIMMFFYYQLGMSLENTWGTFRYNVYIFGGIFYTIIGAFLTWGGLILLAGNQPQRMQSGSSVLMVTLGQYVGMYISTYYICLSIFLAFSVCYPDMQVMLYFIIPVKMKWLAYIYAALVLWDLYQSPWPGRIVILMSMLNFLIFFLSTRDFRKYSPKEIKRKKVYHQAVQPPRPGRGITKHKCTVCGRTELDDPMLEFRFCSRCNGNYEYCQDHLFTHRHR